MSYRIRAGDYPIKLGETDEVTAVLQNVATILGTPKGSVPLYREFGINDRMVDRPLPVAAAMLRSEIIETVEEFEPRAQVVKVVIEQDETDPGRLVPTVEVKIVE